MKDTDTTKLPLSPPLQAVILGAAGAGLFGSVFDGMTTKDMSPIWHWLKPMESVVSILPALLWGTVAFTGFMGGKEIYHAIKEEDNAKRKAHWINALGFFAAFAGCLIISVAPASMAIAASIATPAAFVIAIGLLTCGHWILGKREGKKITSDQFFSTLLPFVPQFFGALALLLFAVHVPFITLPILGSCLIAGTVGAAIGLIVTLYKGRGTITQAISSAAKKLITGDLWSFVGVGSGQQGLGVSIENPLNQLSQTPPPSAPPAPQPA